MEERVKEHAVKRYQRVKEIEREFGTAPEQHGLRSPLPAGVTKTDYERISAQIQSSIETDPAPEDISPSTVGQIQKRISGLDAEAFRNL